MSFYFQSDEDVATGLRRIAHEQTEKALKEINDDQLSEPETVHQIRKRCKKIRGLLRLVRPALGKQYQTENAWYRDSARILSEVRDARSMLNSFDDMLELFSDQVDRQAFAPLRQRLIARRDATEHEHLHVQQRIARFAGRIREAKTRIDRWQLDEDSFDAIAIGLGKTYGRGRDSMDVAYSEPCVTAFHEWRKRVKYHWYHVRLLKKIWSDPLKGYRHQVHELSEFLGDDHDLAVLKEVVSEASGGLDDQKPTNVFLALADRRRKQLQMMSRPIGQRVFCEKPSRLVDRFECYWDAWRASDAVSDSSAVEA